MKSIMNAGAVAALLFAASFAQARPQYTQAEQDSEISTQRPLNRQQQDANAMENKIEIDVAPLLIKGAGISYEREVVPRLAVGPYVNFMSEQSTVQGMDTNYQAVQGGLRARFFLTGNAHRSGINLFAGAGMIDAKDSVTMKSPYGYKVNGNDEVQEFTYQAGGGYQWVVHNFQDVTSLVLNGGAFYGHGYDHEVRASTDIYSNTADTHLTVLDSVYFELGIGLLF